MVHAATKTGRPLDDRQVVLDGQELETLRARRRGRGAKGHRARCLDITEDAEGRTVCAWSPNCFARAKGKPLGCLYWDLPAADQDKAAVWALHSLRPRSPRLPGLAAAAGVDLDQLPPFAPRAEATPAREAAVEEILGAALIDRLAAREAKRAERNRRRRAAREAAGKMQGEFVFASTVQTLVQLGDDPDVAQGRVDEMRRRYAAMRSLRPSD